MSLTTSEARSTSRPYLILRIVGLTNFFAILLSGLAEPCKEGGYFSSRPASAADALCACGRLRFNKFSDVSFTKTVTLH